MSINFINYARSFEVNSNIIEWDMKRAGLNLIKEFQLLPQDTITTLERLPKRECDETIGKMQIKNKELSVSLEKAFTEVMKKFMKVNDIDDEFDVTSIKKDACFVINKKVSVSEFGTYIRFVPKNTYHAYVYLKPYEFYFKRNDEVDVKGLIGDKKIRSQILELHEDGIMNFMKYTIQLAETSCMNMKKINDFLHDFVEMYKKKELDFEYYREFDSVSKYRYQLLGSEILADNIDESMLEKINIDFNYKKIILPLINLLC